MRRRDTCGLAGQVGDRAAVGREAGSPASRDQQPLGSAERLGDVQPTAGAFGPEHDLRPVRRDRGVVVIRVVAGQPGRLPDADVLDVDVEVALAAPVRCVRDEVPVRRNRGPIGDAGISGEALRPQLECRRRAPGGQPRDPRGNGRDPNDGGDQPHPPPRASLFALRDSELPRIRFLLDVLQRDPQVGHRLPAALRVLPQAAGHDAVHLGRDPGGDLAGGRRVLAQDRGQRRDLAVALKGAPSGQHLVEDRPEREDVRPGVHRPAFGLLGRHVGDGPDNRARLGVGTLGERPRRLLAGFGSLGQLSETEVEDLHEALLGHHDVGRLQVSVDDARRVRLRDCVGDLDCAPQRLGKLEPLAADQLIQRTPGHVFHRDERPAVGVADIVDDANVGMVERGGCFGLAAEPRQDLAVPGEILGDELEGDRPLEPDVLGLVDDAHPAAAQLLEDAVVRDRLANHAVPLGSPPHAVAERDRPSGGVCRL